MALISCVECGHQISERAKFCPQCGYDYSLRLQEQRKLDTLRAWSDALSSSEQEKREKAKRLEEEKQKFKEKWHPHLWAFLACFCSWMPIWGFFLVLFDPTPDEPDIFWKSMTLSFSFLPFIYIIVLRKNITI